MMELILGKKTALKAINQDKDLGISHFCSKEKRPQASAYGRDWCVLKFRLPEFYVQVKMSLIIAKAMRVCLP